MRAEQRRLRLFVAVELPENVREALGRLQDELKRQGLSGLRWVRPGAIHLTLKFLGETPAEKAPEIEVALAAAVKGTSPFSLALGETGTFGGGRGPRVLWLALAGELPRLRALQAAVEGALVGIGFPPEERGYSPHLTLARVPQPPAPGTGERVSRALKAVAPPEAAFEVRAVVLMMSTLRPEGAVYECLAAFPLS